MFNTIQESIVVVRGDKISYCNSQAVKLFLRLRRSSSSLSENEIIRNEDILDAKTFYIYNSLGGEERNESEESLLVSNHACYSLKELLMLDKRQAEDLVFTSLKEVTQCDTMDQLQIILSKLTTNENEEIKKKSAFF